VQARKVQDVIAIIRYVIEAAMTLFAVTISSGVAHHYRSFIKAALSSRLGFASWLIIAFAFWGGRSLIEQRVKSKGALRTLHFELCTYFALCSLLVRCSTINTTCNL
jgi:hypothetical protein